VIINIYILKKRRNSSNTVVALDAVREPIAITLPSGASSVDLSGYRIFFGKDYVFGFESPSRDFFTNMKYNNIGQDDSYGFWRAYSLDGSFSQTSINATFNFNLRIGEVAEEYNYGVLGLQKFPISDSDTKSPVKTFDWSNWAVMSHDDDLEDDVLMDSLRFSTVFTASGLTKVALFEKIKTGSVVTSLRLVCCVNVPYSSGDNELDLKPYKLILKKNYCFGFFTKSTGISYKYSESNFPSWDFWTLSSANGTPSKTNYVLNMNFDIMVVKAISMDIQKYASRRSERLYEWNEFTATRTVALAVNNVIVPKKDQEFAGILKRWVFDLPLPTTLQVYIYIMRKVKDGSGNIVGLKRISNPIPVSLVQGQKVVDLSGYNIYFDKDYVFGFSSPTESFYSNLKYLNLGTDDTFMFWRSRSETEDCERTDFNLVFNFNIEIEYITYGNEKEIFSNIALLGDSLTWQGIDNPKIGWFNYLSSKFADFAKLLIYARSGATWSNTPQTVYNITENTGSLSANNVIFNQMNRLIKDYQDGIISEPSAIIIFAGTNDGLFPSARPDALRDTADDVFADISTDYRTGHNINTCLSIAMAYRYVFEMIIEHFPDAQVVIMSPMQSTGFTKERGDAIGTILRDCAGHTSSIFINMANEAGVSRIVETRKGNYLTRDGIHLIQKGAEMVGDFLAHRLISVLR
jgi:lysophospholipase L1-like esterase